MPRLIFRAALPVTILHAQRRIKNQSRSTPTSAEIIEMKSVGLKALDSTNKLTFSDRGSSLGEVLVHYGGLGS